MSIYFFQWFLLEDMQPMWPTVRLSLSKVSLRWFFSALPVWPASLLEYPSVGGYIFSMRSSTHTQTYTHTHTSTMHNAEQIHRELQIVKPILKKASFTGCRDNSMMWICCGDGVRGAAHLVEVIVKENKARCRIWATSQLKGQNRSSPFRSLWEASRASMYICWLHLLKWKKKCK